MKKSVIPSLLEERRKVQQLVRELKKVEQQLDEAGGWAEELLVQWSMETTDEVLEHPVLQALAKARQASIQLAMGWSEQVARAVVRKALTAHPDVPLPRAIMGDERACKARADLRLLEWKRDDTRSRINNAHDSYVRAKKLAQDELRLRLGSRTDVLQGSTNGGRYANRPPMVRQLPETMSISAQRGWRHAPAQHLMAIAHGLALVDHWWLYEARHWSKPVSDAPPGFPEIREAWERSTEGFGSMYQPPQVGFYGDRRRRSRLLFRYGTGKNATQCLTEEVENGEPDADLREMRWHPVGYGPELSSFGNYDRKVVIRVEPSASTGTIEWCTGKWYELGYEHTCSYFIGHILATLPGAVDDGSIDRMVQDQEASNGRGGCGGYGP